MLPRHAPMFPALGRLVSALRRNLVQRTARQAMPMQQGADAAQQGAQSLAVDSGECLGKCLV